jgi:hypothetical protein
MDVMLQILLTSAIDELSLEHFRAKQSSGLTRRWIPVRVKKTRQNKKLEPRF